MIGKRLQPLIWGTGWEKPPVCSPGAAPPGKFVGEDTLPGGAAQYGSNKGKASSPGRTQGGFPPTCSPGAAPPGNGMSVEASPEALLRGYMSGDFPTGSPPQGLLCILPSLLPLI